MRNHILYIENDQDEMESLAELIELDGFRVSKAATIEVARKILADDQIHLILIDIYTSEHMGDYSGLKLVNDPLYESIPKIAIIIDPSDPRATTLKNISSVVHISYKQDPKRLQKLMAALNGI